jgi:hypothetical protein
VNLGKVESQKTQVTVTVTQTAEILIAKKGSRSRLSPQSCLDRDGFMDKSRRAESDPRCLSPLRNIRPSPPSRNADLHTRRPTRRVFGVSTSHRHIVTVGLFGSVMAPAGMKKRGCRHSSVRASGSASPRRLHDKGKGKLVIRAICEGLESLGERVRVSSN